MDSANRTAVPVGGQIPGSSYSAILPECSPHFEFTFDQWLKM